MDNSNSNNNDSASEGEDDEDGSSMENGSSSSSSPAGSSSPDDGSSDEDDGSSNEEVDDDDDDDSSSAEPRSPWTAFRTAIETGETLESIRTLIEEERWHDAIFRAPRTDGSYTLHRAASTRAVRPDVLQYIIDAHPPALQVRNEAGHLPIHCAIMNRLHVSQIRVLIEAWKPSLREYTLSGFLPLHLTVRDREKEGFEWDGRNFDSSFDVSPLPVIKYLVDEWSDALITGSIPNQDEDEVRRPVAERGDGMGGLLPIHLAVGVMAMGDDEMRRNLQIVTYMADSRPEALRMRTADGRIALHVAINTLADTPILEVLVDRYPASIRTRTRSGYLPLHLAFVWHDGSKYETEHSGCGVRSSDVVKFLVESWPGSLRIPEPENGYLAAHLAMTPNDYELHDENGSDSIRYLLEAWPGAARVTSRSGNTVLHCAAAAGESLELIQAVVNYNPSAVRIKGYDDRLPIHYFIYMWSDQRDRRGHNEAREASALSVIRYFLEQWPESATEEDKDGCLPIHHACESKMSQDVLECLIRRSPESLLKRSSFYGHIPLHILASEDEPQLPAIQLLVTHSPQSLLEKADNGDLALHVVLQESQDSDVIEFLIQSCPESLREANEEGHLPIHVAIDQGVPSDLLRAIFEPWRDAARVATLNCKGRLPLHLAALKGTPLPFLREIIEAHPPAVREVDGDGWLPIHCAAMSSSEPSAAMDLLLEKWPESLTKTTSNNWTVLHLLCRNFSSTSRTAMVERNRMAMARATPRATLIDQLCATNPLMASAATDKGLLPLHVGLMHALPSDAIRRLLHHFPGAVRHPAPQSWIPLHFAMAHGAPEDQVRLLVNEWPDSVEARTTDHDMLALHVGAAEKATTAGIRVLLEHSPQSVQATARGGVLAVHLAAQRDVFDRSAPGLVRFLVDQWPESVDSATDEGLVPLHFAAARKTDRSTWANHHDIDEMVEFLAEMRPDSLVAATRTGWIPLHFAASAKEASVDVVRFLVDLQPETALVRNHDGQIPLHLAALGLRRDVVKCLLTNAPMESVRAVDHRGRLPLHAAVDRSRDTSPYVDLHLLMGTTTALVEAWPDSVRQLDNCHRLPIHLAALSDCHVNVLFYLIKAYPESIRPMMTTAAAAAEPSPEDVAPAAASATIIVGAGRNDHVPPPGPPLRPSLPAVPTTKKRALSPTST